MNKILYHLQTEQRRKDFYRKICEQAKAFLNDNSYLIFEIGCNQANDVSKILQDNGFTDIEVKKDYGGNDRVIIARYAQ